MKIAVIGGAGVRTVIFINGLLDRYRKLGIGEVALYDIDREKLEIIHKLCLQVVRRRGEELCVRVAETPEELLRGADYVVTTLRVGGDASRVADEETALRAGVIGQETTGAGGFAMAARTIPVLLEYAALIERYAPQALVFNFTNPSGLVTQALQKAGYTKVVGICDAPSSTKFRMAKDLGVTEDRLYVEFFGLNHLSWIRSVRQDGRELLPSLLADDAFLRRIQEFSMFDPELLRIIGYLPNEYLYYFYHREKALENILSASAARGRAIQKINEAMFAELKKADFEKDPEGALQIFLYGMQERENSYMSVESGTEERPKLPKGQLEVPDGMGYAGVMLDCIEALQSREEKSLVLSVPNGGCMEGLEDDDVVEVTCMVSEAGIRPVPIGRIPEHCYLLVRQIKMYEKLTGEAMLEKNRAKAELALTCHPLVQSYSLAKKLVEEYDKLYHLF